MSRTLNDDFDEDDPAAGGGSFDLEKGSPTGAGGMGGGATSYDGSGRELDDDDPFGDETPNASLELDLPPGTPTALRAAGAPAPPPPGGVPELAFAPPPAARPTGPDAAAPPPPAPSSARSLGPNESGGLPLQAPPSGHEPPPSSTPGDAAAPAAPLPPARPQAAAVIAQYPDAPEKVWQAPKYALQVLLRQLELRSNLESLRRRRSPDVPLYEAALKAYDPKTFRLGLALNLAIFVVATFLFFLPVMLRGE